MPLSLIVRVAPSRDTSLSLRWWFLSERLHTLPSLCATHRHVILLTTDWHKFKRLLASKTFAVHDTKRIRGEDLTAAWAGEGGFREPVIAPDKTGMGLKVQPAVLL